MGKKETIQTIYDVLQGPLELDIEKIGISDNLVRLDVDSDEWSFVFIPELNKRLGCSSSVDDWKNLNPTINEIAEMYERLMTKPADHAAEVVPSRCTAWRRLFGWKT